jgi:excisionase family DNA binding protein
MNVEPATPQAKIEPLALNLTDAAALLGCTLSCLRRLLWANKLKYIRLGKRFVIPVQELREFIDRQAA